MVKSGFLNTYPTFRQKSTRGNFRVADDPSLFRTSTVHGASDAGVPGIAGLCSRRAETLTKPFQIVCDRQAVDEFYVLVADLPRESYAKRSAVSHWKLMAVHAVAEESLRMQSIGHIDAVPSIGLHGSVHDVSGLWVNSHKVQHMRERDADPLGYV